VTCLPARLPARPRRELPTRDLPAVHLGRHDLRYHCPAQAEGAAVVKRPEHLGYPDLNDLPETAQKIVDAARMLLVNEGWRGLTIPAIAESAGVYTPAVNYYFGSQAGLVAMIFDSIMRGTIDGTRATLEHLPPGRDRLLAIAEAILDNPQIMGQETDVAFFETLPHLVRDPQLKERTLDRYRAWEDTIVWALADREGENSDAERRTPAIMLLAMIDGLSIRKLLEPDDPAIDEALRRFARMLEEDTGPPDALTPQTPRAQPRD
jgi:AcrR family transcriptional regulator